MLLGYLSGATCIKVISTLLGFSKWRNLYQGYIKVLSRLLGYHKWSDTIPKVIKDYVMCYSYIIHLWSRSYFFEMVLFFWNGIKIILMMMKTSGLFIKSLACYLALDIVKHLMSRWNHSLLYINRSKYSDNIRRLGHLWLVTVGYGEHYFSSVGANWVSFAY